MQIKVCARDNASAARTVCSARSMYLSVSGGRLPFLQHSPSLRTQSRGCGKVLLLGRRQAVGKHVSCSIVHGAVHKAGEPLFNGPANAVGLYTDVRSGMV